MKINSRNQTLLIIGPTILLLYSYDLMSQCWSSEPTKRPDFSSAETAIGKCLYASERQVILSNILSTISKYFIKFLWCN